MKLSPKTQIDYKQIDGNYQKLLNADKDYWFILTCGNMTGGFTVQLLSHNSNIDVLMKSTKVTKVVEAGRVQPIICCFCAVYISPSL